MLDRDHVFSYLIRHPEDVDAFVEQHVTDERLEGWVNDRRKGKDDDEDKEMAPAENNSGESESDFGTLCYFHFRNIYDIHLCF